MSSSHKVTAIEETALKTNVNEWKIGDVINLERSLRLDSRWMGILYRACGYSRHCIEISEKQGSWEYEFRFPKKFSELIIEKGSICINGISLTAFDVKKRVSELPSSLTLLNRPISKRSKGTTGKY
jgi:riboflavin synthase